jgi:hypothetical protein
MMETNRNDESFTPGSRTTIATVLIGAAVVALAATSLVRTYQPAAAQTALDTTPAPVAANEPASVAPDSADIGHFAFGYVVFDWDPRAPGGVPGFDSWPPGSRR